MKALSVMITLNIKSCSLIVLVVYGHLRIRLIFLHGCICGLKRESVCLRVVKTNLHYTPRFTISIAYTNTSIEEEVTHLGV